MKAIKLTTVDNILIDKYSDDDGDILVELDSTIAAFSITLPDLKSCGERVFAFKNYGANNVTLSTVHGQIIDYAEVISKTIVYKEFYSIASNGADKWISLETNVYPLNIACTDLASSIALINQIRLDHI